MDLSQISLIVIGLIFVLLGLGIRLAILLIAQQRQPVFYGNHNGSEKLDRILKITVWITSAALLIGVGLLILGFLTFIL
jgi:predicted RND superfamily exporter protein